MVIDRPRFDASRQPRRAILPLLRQVADAARDLALSPRQVIDQLQPLLQKGAEDDGSDARDDKRS